MDEYYQKYAKPLGKLSMFDLRNNLNTWRENLKDELEGILYLRNGLNFNGNNSNNRIDTTSKNKLIDVINKLECLLLKNIECISEFLIELERSKSYEVDEQIYNKMEFIRENYNKILLNIQKLTSSNPVLIESRDQFEKNKTSITETLHSFKPSSDIESKKDYSNKKNYSSNFIFEKEKIEQGREWLEKLNKDLDDIDKDHSRLFINKNLSDTSRIDRSINFRDRETHSELDKLERQFHNLQKLAENNSYLDKEIAAGKVSENMVKISKPKDKSSIKESSSKAKIKAGSQITANKSQKLNKSNSNINTSSSKKNKTHVQLKANKDNSSSINNLNVKNSANLNNITNNNKENYNIDISEITNSYLKEKETSLNANKLSYNHIKNFTEELERIKNFCREIKKAQEENCIMENEKKTFDKMKNEYIKLSADLSIMKEDIKEILSNYHALLKRVNYIEEENKNLRSHNKNLVKLIQQRNNNINNNFPNEFYDLNENDIQNNYVSDYTDNINRVQSKYNQITKNNHQQINSFANTPTNNKINILENNNSVPLSDLSAFNNINNTSSNEMMTNINSNLECKKSNRRFLIQKENGDYQDYSYDNALHNTLNNPNNKPGSKHNYGDYNINNNQTNNRINLNIDDNEYANRANIQSNFSYISQNPNDYVNEYKINTSNIPKTSYTNNMNPVKNY